MTVDIAYINNLAPEFSGETDARINFCISIGGSMINQTFWPADKVDFAIALYTCHLLKMGKMRGSVALAGEKVGDLSKTFSVPNFNNALQTTGYGVMLMQLMSTLVITPMVVGSGPSPFVWASPYNTTLTWPD